MTFRVAHSDGSSTGTGHLTGHKAAVAHGVPFSYAMPPHRSERELIADRERDEERKRTGAASAALHLKWRNEAEDELQRWTSLFPKLRNIAVARRRRGYSAREVLRDPEFSRVMKRAALLPRGQA